MANSKYLSLVEDPIGTGIGDRVRVELNSFDVVKGAALLYLFPVSSLIVGAFLGFSLSSLTVFSEGVGIFGGCFSGLVLALLVIKKVDGSRWARRKLNPTITAVLKPSAGGDYYVKQSAVSCCR